MNRRESSTQGLIVAFSLAALATAIWAANHRFHGLTGDGELYAMQALARLDTAFGTDLYLKYESQDRYTVFSPLYALAIQALGLRTAAVTLYVAATLWSLVAAWWLVRRLSERRAAWAALAIMAVTIAQYGAYTVFHVAEDFVTARSFAEALILTALAAHFAARPRLALLLAVLAFCLHPLMATPGILLLLCLWVPPRISAAGAVAGVLAVLAIAAGSLVAPPTWHWLRRVDPAWLEVIRERSQFVFLQLWRLDDWKLNVRPFASLGFTLGAVADPRIRSLSRAALLVGAAGLAVALIAGTLGPVALLLEGQAWRWVWITSCVAVLLIAPTMAAVWSDAKCGPLCAALLLCAWTVSPLDPLACLGLTLGLWLVRPYITPRVAIYLRWASFALAVIVLAWTIAVALNNATSASPESGRESAWLARLRNVVGTPTAALLLFGLPAWLVLRARHWRMPLALGIAGAIGAACLLPGSLRQLQTAGSAAEIAEFADWRNAMPDPAQVFCVGVPNSAAFVWFTLRRESYISADQSAGVIFSRPTAMEVQRRSAVVAALEEPTWKIMTRLSKKPGPEPQGKVLGPQLSAAVLGEICRDPELGFVVGRQNVGFGGLRHGQPGPFKDWYLYDCRQVRRLSPAA